MRSTAALAAADAQAQPASQHWAWPLIGRPYRGQGRDPEGFDCWGLLQYCWRLRLGIEVPDVRLDAKENFRQAMHGRYSDSAREALAVARPIELDAVFMTSLKDPHHVGLWIEPDPIGGILHADEKVGVVFQRRASLPAHGVTIVQFMRWQV